MVIYKHGSAEGFLVTYFHRWPLGMFIQEREMTPVSGGWREWVMLHLEHSHKLISEFKTGLRSKVVCSYNCTNQHGNLNCNILRGSTCRYMQTLHCFQCCRHGLDNLSIVGIIFFGFQILEKPWGRVDEEYIMQSGEETGKPQLESSKSFAPL